MNNMTFAVLIGGPCSKIFVRLQRGPHANKHYDLPKFILFPSIYYRKYTRSDVQCINIQLFNIALEKRFRQSFALREEFLYVT